MSLQGPASVLIFDHGEDQRTAVEGLTFTGGRGTRWGPGFSESGSGAGSWDSYPRFVECSFLENRACRGGGGVHVEGVGARPVFENCAISKNISYGISTAGKRCRRSRMRAAGQMTARTA